MSHLFPLSTNNKLSTRVKEGAHSEFTQIFITYTSHYHDSQSSLDNILDKAAAGGVERT